MTTTTKLLCLAAEVDHLVRVYAADKSKQTKMEKQVVKMLGDVHPKVTVHGEGTTIEIDTPDAFSQVADKLKDLPGGFDKFKDSLPKKAQATLDHLSAGKRVKVEVNPTGDMTVNGMSLGRVDLDDDFALPAEIYNFGIRDWVHEVKDHVVQYLRKNKEDTQDVEDELDNIADNYRT